MNDESILKKLRNRVYEFINETGNYPDAVVVSEELWEKIKHLPWGFKGEDSKLKTPPLIIKDAGLDTYDVKLLAKIRLGVISLHTALPEATGG